MTSTGNTEQEAQSSLREQMRLLTTPSYLLTEEERTALGLDEFTDRPEDAPDPDEVDDTASPFAAVPVEGSRQDGRHGLRRPAATDTESANTEPTSRGSALKRPTAARPAGLRRPGQ